MSNELDEPGLEADRTRAKVDLSTSVRRDKSRQRGVVGRQNSLTLQGTQLETPPTASVQVIDSQSPPVPRQTVLP